MQCNTIQFNKTSFLLFKKKKFSLKWRFGLDDTNKLLKRLIDNQRDKLSKISVV